MIIPMRCYSCGYPVSKHWLEFKDRVTKGESVKAALDGLGIERYCCRSLFMTQHDVLSDVAKFKV